MGHPPGASYAGYDHQGNIISTTNVRGASTLTSYDALGRVSSIDRPAGVGEWDLDFTYDPISRKRASVTTADSAYSDAWEYDDYGRVKRQVRSYYDTLVMDFEYDLLGRPTKIYYPSNGSSVSYVYQGAYLEQVCRGDDFCASAPPQDVLIADVLYDDLGRRTDTVTYKGTLHREYYGITDDPTGRSVNALKRLALTAGSSAGALDFNYQYDSIGNMTGIDDQSTLYNASATYTYDARNRLESWTDASGTPPVWYGYDVLGNLKGHGAASLNEVDFNQTFDTATKPHQITQNRIGEAYAYDADGNVIQRGLPGGPTEHFVYDSANRLVCTGTGPDSCDGPGYRYDVDGQLMWDGAARQLRMGELFKWQSSGFVAYSNIAAFGEVLAQVRQNGIRLRAAWAPVGWPLPIPKGPFLWMLAGAGLLSLLALLAWLGAGSAFREAPATATFALALTAMLVVPPPAWGMGFGGGGTTLRFFFRDHLGSVAYRTGPNVRQAYEPFGKALLAAAGAKDEFTSKEYHGATEMYYFGARWYDAEAGRFASVDPLVTEPENPQQLNAYGYVLNDPVNLTDPTGMCVRPNVACGIYTTVGVRYTITPPGGGRSFSYSGDNVNGFVAALNNQSANGGTANTSRGADAGTSVVFRGGAAPSVSAGADQGGGFWRGVRNTLSRWAGEIGGAIKAPFAHIARGLANIYGGVRDMIKGTPGGFGRAMRGLGELVLGTPFPAIGPNGGAFWTGSPSGDQNSYAASRHDLGMDRPGPPGWLNPAPIGALSSHHTFQYINDSFFGPGFQPGPYGQAYRLAGAAVFGAYGSLLRLAGQ